MDEKFQQTVNVINKLEEFIYLLDLMNSVWKKVVTNQTISNVPKKGNLICLVIIIFSLRVMLGWNMRDNKNLLLNLKS